MKKILAVFLLIFTGLCLSSCKSDEQKVTITNDDGEQVEVLITPSEDREVVKNALTYASQANYEEIEGISVSVSSSLDMIYNEVNKANFSASASAVGNQEVFNGKFNYNASTTGELFGEMNLNMDSSFNYDLADNYIYMDAKTEIDGQVEQEKIKVLASAILEGALGPSSPAPVAKMADGGFNGSFDFDGSFDLDINQTIDLFYVMMPKSSLEVVAVDNKLYTVRFNLSMEDILKIVDSTGQTNLERDFFITLDVSFNVEDGYFAGLNLTVDNGFLISLLTEEEVDEAKAKFTFNLNISAEYGKVEVVRLSDAEKADYVEK